jgi:hypothetical protein
MSLPLFHATRGARLALSSWSVSIAFLRRLRRGKHGPDGELQAVRYPAGADIIRTRDLSRWSGSDPKPTSTSPA